MNYLDMLEACLYGVLGGFIVGFCMIIVGFLSYKLCDTLFKIFKI